MSVKSTVRRHFSRVYAITVILDRKPRVGRYYQNLQFSPDIRIIESSEFDIFQEQIKNLQMAHTTGKPKFLYVGRVLLRKPFDYPRRLSITVWTSKNPKNPTTSSREIQRIASDWG